MSIWSCGGWSYDGVLQRKELHPFGQVVGAKYAKISLKLLVGSFSLSISLRMIGSGQVNVISEEASEFSGESGCELGALIQDESIV